MNGKSGIIPGNYVEADGGAETVVSASLQVLFRSGGGGKKHFGMDIAVTL